MNFDRMRALLLEQAIRGELVPQLDSEGVVEQVGGVPEEVPFGIPSSWSWVQLEKLSCKRKTVEPSSLSLEAVELWSIPAYDEGTPKIVKPSDIGSSKKVIQVGDVLLAKIVPHIKRAWVVSETESQLMKLASTEWLVYNSERHFPIFLVLLFKSPYFRSKMMGSISGMGSLKRANPRALSKVWLPIPPLEEQQRIVAKVEELLKQVNALKM